MAIKQSELYRRQAAAVDDFLAAFGSLLDLCEPTADFGSMPTWKARQEANLSALNYQRTSLDRRSGPAAEAVESVGAIYQYKPRGTMATVPANPVLMAGTLFKDPMVDAETVYTCCNRAIGLLKQHQADAEEHERSLEGRVERLVGAPWRLLRAAFGGTAYMPALDAGLTILSAIVAGLVVAYLSHLLQWV